MSCRKGTADDKVVVLFSPAAIELVSACNLSGPGDMQSDAAGGRRMGRPR
jgi:hypothetical protein